MPDTTAEVKAIVAGALRELEQVIDNPRVKSLLRHLRDILGVEEGAAMAATRPISRRAPRAKPKREVKAKSAQATPRARTPAKPRAASTARASSSAPAARSGGRRDQLLALVVDQPGICRSGGQAVRHQRRDGTLQGRPSASGRRARAQARRRAAPNRQGKTEIATAPEVDQERGRRRCPSGPAP